MKRNKDDNPSLNIINNQKRESNLFKLVNIIEHLSTVSLRLLLGKLSDPALKELAFLLASEKSKEECTCDNKSFFTETIYRCKNCNKPIKLNLD